MPWDEDEQFAGRFVKAAACVLIVLGLTLAAVSVATGQSEFFKTFLRLLGLLGAILLGYLCVVGGTAIALRGVGRGISRWASRLRG